MDGWEIPEALTPLITSKPLNGRDPSSQRIRRISTPYLPWADILTTRTSDSVGYITFRAMEVLHKLGVEEIILAYTRFEEGTNLENFDVMLVPAQQNKLRALKKFFHDGCRRVSAEVNKRSSARLGDVLHDHVVNLQEQASLREIERWSEQGWGMYQYQAITRIWLSNSVKYQRGVTSSRDEIPQRLEGSQVQVHGG
jgi:hypothetical protein